MTERARYIFTVKEGMDGRPWLALEPWDSELPALKDVLVGLDLEKGSSLEKAHELADRLNRAVEFVSWTKLPRG